MDGKVRVAVRCRPLIPMEINEGCQTCISYRPEVNQIIMSDSRQFTFDYVFPPETSQEDVYMQCAHNLIDSIFQGFNATIFAYGQTGSGKTYTMGTADTGTNDSSSVGIIPKVIDNVFQKIQSLSGTHSCDTRTSFLEIYNEELHDLLDEPSRILNIREHPDGGIQIVGLSEVVTDDSKSVLDCLNNGAENRSVGTTAMNERSSRSHAILTIYLKIQNINEEDDSCSAKFHLVDLAGSERVKKTQAEGSRFKEGVNINRGLLALGQVVSALCERESNSTKRTHIPYRDSRLTRILQDSLGGNSHTIMIACVSPADKNFEETLNTLRYADRARQIKNKPTVNRDPKAMEILQLKELVRTLQAQLDPSVSIRNISSMSMPALNSNNVVDRDKYIELQRENRILIQELDQAIDRSTVLTRQVLQMELLQDQLNPRFDGLKTALSSLIKEYRSDSRPPDVEDLEEQLKSITELHLSLLEPDQIITGSESYEKVDASDEIAGTKPLSEIPEVSESAEAQDESSETEEKEKDHKIQEEAEATARVQRVAMHRELSALDSALRLKERLLASMQANNEEFSKKISIYEEQIVALSDTIKKMENERDQMENQLKHDTENISGSATSAQTKIRTRLRELEGQLSGMRNQMTELKRVKREREQREAECGRLKEEISKLKATKVRMVRQMAEDSAANKRWRAAKEMEVRKLQEKDRKMQNELAKMNAAHQRRTAVLKRKMEAAAAAERRLKETLLRQRESVNQRIRRVEGNDKSSTNIRIKNWLTGEIDKSVSISEAKSQLESLLEDRKGVAEQLAHARRAGRQADVEELEMELRRRNQQIGNLQSMLSDAEQDEQIEAARWDYLHSLLEARCGLKYLFKELIKSRSLLREKSSESEDLACQMRQQEEEFHEIQNRLEVQLQTHENSSRHLLKEMEQLRRDNTALRERLQVIEVRPHMDDKGTTPFPQRKKRRVSEYEEYSEVESFMDSVVEDDPNDSDWHLTPFIAKKRKKKSEEKIQNRTFDTQPSENVKVRESEEPRASDVTSVTDISPSKVSSEVEEKKTKCRCRKICNKRCGCRKLGTRCQDNCECSVEICGNRDETVSQMSNESDLKEDSTRENVGNERPTEFGGSVAANVPTVRDGSRRLTATKRKLLDPRTTIFDSPLLH